MKICGKTKKNKIRFAVQVIFTALTNGYILGYMKGTIYKGPSKGVCVPELNYYSYSLDRKSVV